MTAKKKTGDPKGRRRQPLVNVNQAVLRALMEERGLTIARLARMSGELEQTLAHLLKTPGARCQRGRLKRIARTLNVPDEMLSGDPYAIPFAVFVPDGFEFRYSLKTVLAASRYATQVVAAFRRDLDAEEKRRDIARFAPRPVIESMLASFFLELIQIREWRRRFIRWDPAVEEARGYSEPATRNPWSPPLRTRRNDDGSIRVTMTPQPEKDPDHEAAILGIVRGLEHLFAPWFVGDAQLDYRALRDFSHLPAHPFAQAKEIIPPTSPLAVLFPPVTEGPTT